MPPQEKSEAHKNYKGCFREATFFGTGNLPSPGAEAFSVGLNHPAIPVRGIL